MSIFQRIFGRRTTPAPDRAATAPLDPKMTLGTGRRKHVVVGAAHSLGLERSQDDDALLVLTGGSDGHEGLIDFGLFCVADGLGGYEHGNLASSIAVRTVARRLTQGAFLRLMELEPSNEEEPLEDMVRSAFVEANEAILKHAEGGATTLTITLLLGEYLMIGHVGDTRAYLLNEKKVDVLTKDQSMVKKLVDMGAMTEDEAAESPHRNVLWNAMGRTEELEVEVFSYPILHDGYLLLCSDGLWGQISDDEIQDIVLGADHPQQACDTLVQAATESGGSDNITAVLIHFPPKLEF
ncbi:MAG: hypothetical protein GTO14_01305 [Anaerolineales bacterium]|nr:hypothetical protein [Anaerolineales bacterium]